MIECRCKTTIHCPVEIRCDIEKRQLLFTDGYGYTEAMFLDANAVSDLMAELASMLAAMVEGRTKQEVT